MAAPRCLAASAVAAPAVATSAARLSQLTARRRISAVSRWAPRTVLREGGRLPKVIGDQLGERVLSPGGAAFEPAGRRRVQVRPLRAKERLVGHLPDQDVAEGEAVAGRRPDEVLPDEPIHQRVAVGDQIRPERGDPRRPERPAEHRAELQEPALLGLEEIEACQDRRLDRVGERRQAHARLRRRRSATRHAPGSTGRSPRRRRGCPPPGSRRPPPSGGRQRRACDARAARRPRRSEARATWRRSFAGPRPIPGGDRAAPDVSGRS